MVLAHEDDESADAGQPQAYWYGRIIAIFHAFVRQGPLSTTSGAERVDFLWVRWLGQDPNHRSGFKAKGLPRVGFVPSDDGAFRFSDPQEIVRAIRLVP